MSDSMTPALMGREFQVNTTTRSNQYLYQVPQALTALADGGFLAAWWDHDAGRNINGVVLQRFDSEGLKVGGEFVPDAGTYNFGVVAGLPDGGFVVSWAAQVGGTDAFTRRFDADGDPVGPSTQVNQFGAFSQIPSSTAVQDDGTYLIVWTSQGQDGSEDGVFARVYGPDGSPGDEFQVNTHTPGNQQSGHATALSDGRFLITWSSGGHGLDTDGAAIYGRIFDSDGTPLGGEFEVNSHAEGNQEASVATALSGGGFVVTWMSAPQDGSGRGVYAQMYDDLGQRVGAEFLVPTTTFADQWFPAVTATTDGGFLIAWYSLDGPPGFGTGIFAQRFAADGTRLGDEFRINTNGPGDQRYMKLATLADGSVMVIWEDAPDLAADGDGAGVFGQRLYLPGATEGPFAAADTGTATEDGGPILIDILANDVLPDGIVPTITLDTTGLIGTARFEDGQLVYDPGINFQSLTGNRSATTSLGYTIDDGEGHRVSGTVTITVDGQDDMPMTIARASVRENTVSVAYTFELLHEDDEPLTYAVSGRDAALFRIDEVGNLFFLAGPDFEAPSDYGANNVYNLVLSASDGLSVANQALFLTVTDRIYENRAPVITTAAAISFAENATGPVFTVTATDSTDIEAPGTPVLTYGLSGTDAARFSIDSVTGAVAFLSPPNFEAPGDAGGDNIYDIIVTATDGEFTGVQAVAITVTDVNDRPPTITSGATVQVAENRTNTIYTATATDTDGGAITWSISGADAALFAINATTGALRFRAGPDFEAPGDAGANNIYDIIVTARDGLNATDRALAVTLTDVADLIRGNAGHDLLVGGDLADTLNGLAGNDTLVGNDGDDFLDGGVGADSMAGGDGNDTYTVASTDDVVLEAPAGGIDRVRSSVTYTLTAEVEALSLLGTAAIDGTGNGLGNDIDGTNGNNRLLGLAGEDTLDGRGGDDTLEGGEGNDQLLGGAGADRLDGGDGDDQLTGGGGGDTLEGGLGQDRLIGTAGSVDSFFWASAGLGLDRVVQFRAGEDLLVFSASGFGLSPGAVPAASFAVNTTGLSTSAAGVGQFVYESDVGRLWWDADGGGGRGEAIAMLLGNPALTIADLLVVA